MKTQNKRLYGILLTASLVLSLPLIGMQFSHEVNWSIFDFIIAGILLFGTGLLIEVVLRKFKNPRQRLALCGVLIIALFLIWAELAVGIFGTPFAGS